MDSRERAFLAVTRQRPDRIPIDFWASPGLLSKLQSETAASSEEFLESHDVDFRYIAGPDYIGPPLTSRGPDSVDIWGVPRKLVQVKLRGGIEHYAEVARPPLADASAVEQILAYHHWPSPDWFDYRAIEHQCDQVLRNKRAVVFAGDRLNRVAQLKPAMYLRGMEQILIDMALSPGIAHAIFRKIREFYLAYLEHILEAAKGKIDIVLTGDDFGAQNGLLVSAATWDEFLSEGFAQYLGLANSRGAKTMHHTCGSVAPLIPRMIACGLDVLQSLQPEAQGMRPSDLKAQFGPHIAFHGGVSIQRTMPFGTREDVHAEVKELAHTMGEGGGYIFCTAHNLQADTPVENVHELMAAYHRYGRY